MNVLPPSSFSGHSNEELILMLQRAESRILAQEREHSVDGGIFVRDGDLANLKQESGRPWKWSSSKKQTISLEFSEPPQLPNEILRLIASQSNRATLAQLARTSFVWLEVASPFLYERFEPRNREDMQNFEIPIYSPALSTLLPRLSLDKVVHLIIPVEQHSSGYGRDRFKFNKVVEDSESASQAAHSIKFPILSFPNLQTLNLSISQCVNPSIPDQIVMFPVFALLASLNPTELTFSSTGLWSPRWMLRENFLTRCLFAWTNLKFVTCRNISLYFAIDDVNPTSEGEDEDEDSEEEEEEEPQEILHLFEIDPELYSRRKSNIRFIWDVFETQTNTLATIIEGLEDDRTLCRAWNTEKGALEILVGKEEDAEVARDWLTFGDQENEEELRAMVNVVCLEEEDRADRLLRLTTEERVNQEEVSKRRYE